MNRNRVCTSCGETKPLTEGFQPRKSCRDGYTPRCKVCIAAGKRRYYADNKDARLAAYRRWREKNLDKAREQNRDCQARARAANPEATRQAKRKYMRSPLRRIGTQLWKVLKGRKAGRPCQEIVGYSEQDLRAHLERQFTRGMTWDNYGEWHIDHIVPLASFTITGPDDPEVRRAWGLPNLRPLWAKDNLTKHARRTALI